MTKTRYQSAENGTDQAVALARRRIERHDGRQAEQGLAAMRIGDEEARDQRQADQAADIAGRPAEARQGAELLVGDERHHHGVGEDGGKLGADGGEAEGEQHEGCEVGAAGRRKPQAEQPDHQQHGEEGDPRLAVLARVGDGAEHGRKRGGDQLGNAGGVGPQRRAPRRIGHEAVDEIGGEQEGDDEGVERLRRPVEQHPADQRALSRPRGRRPGFRATDGRRHRARSDGWAARYGRLCRAGNAWRESCRSAPPRG